MVTTAALRATETSQKKRNAGDYRYAAAKVPGYKVPAILNKLENYFKEICVKKNSV